MRDTHTVYTSMMANDRRYQSAMATASKTGDAFTVSQPRRTTINWWMIGALVFAGLGWGLIIMAVSYA